jgi:predicted N-acyltransferase
MLATGWGWGEVDIIFSKTKVPEIFRKTIPEISKIFSEEIFIFKKSWAPLFYFFGGCYTPHPQVARPWTVVHNATKWLI